MNKETTKTKRKNMICTTECSECIYSDIEDSENIKLRFYCGKKDKSYIYGQYISCDFKEYRSEK